MPLPDVLRTLRRQLTDPAAADAFAEGRRAALLELADVPATREALRAAMNAAMVDEFGDGAAEIPPPGDDDDPDYALDQQRLTRVAAHLAAGYLTQAHQETNP